MNNKYCKIIFLTLVFFLVFVYEASAETIQAPKILEVLANGAVIKGEANLNSEVLIYIDGNYIGVARSEKIDEKKSSFYYENKTILHKGSHTVIAIAKDKTSLVLSPPSQEYKFDVIPLPAPTLIEPNEKTATGKVKPLILGLTLSNTFVRIYIDGIYYGKTEVVSHGSGTANFSYSPFLNLKRGWHKVYAVSENILGEKSLKSATLNFEVQWPMPAPTMYQPVVNLNTASNRPFIVGLAKNDSKIKVYIDKKFAGQFIVANHPSGVANFAFKTPKVLTKGNHLVYTTATDKKGKESSWSNIIYFSVRIPAIAQSAQEEKETVAEIEEPVQQKDESAIISEEGEVKKTEEINQEDKAIGNKIDLLEQNLSEKTEKNIEDIKKLIGEEGKVEKNQISTGMINEGEQNQGKLRLNLVVFIVFLLGVMAWLFWVNRELIKERKEQDFDQSEKSQESDKNNTLGI